MVVRNGYNFYEQILLSFRNIFLFTYISKHPEPKCEKENIFIGFVVTLLSQGLKNKSIDSLNVPLHGNL